MQTLKDIFVPYEIAQKLKEIGFDEPCLAYYDDKLIEITYPIFSFNNKYEPIAPTYEQVFKWFREKGYHIIIDKVSDRYGYFIRQKERIDGETKTDIYEQAREQAILKTIEIYEQTNKVPSVGQQE